MKYRNKPTEMKYKAYKNKLPVIMRQAKKEYYTKKLKENKNNIKATLTILNSVIKNNSTSFPHDGTELANDFNSFLVNYVPYLAKFIEAHDVCKCGTGGSETLQSNYLGHVSENEILTIVKKSKNNTSADCDGIDKTTVKKTIDCIIKPLNYICNL